MTGIEVLSTLFVDVNRVSAHVFVIGVAAIFVIAVVV